MPTITTEEYKQLIEKLRDKLTPEFFDTLIECAKIIGWEVDFSEVHNFINLLYRNINQTSPPIDPYEIDWSTLHK